MNNPSRIFRFKLNQTENLPGSPILMPPGSSVLSVGIMPSGPCAFALVPAPSLEATEPHFFARVKTGEDAPEWLGDCRFLGTLIMQTLKNPLVPIVEHVFEISENEAKALAIGI